ncbi:MAG: MBL fold metallo-hydrolase [Pseudomonadales bacterium]|nr:MBL fold metallo-hydrolase [Pseudomonadales bacterium]
MVEPAGPPSAAERAAPTRIVMLGTGTPVPDARRAGSGVALIHRGEAWLFDLGAGVVRRAMEARVTYELPALYPTRIRGAFLSHLHSDHVVDYPELIATLWWRRAAPLEIHAPTGFAAMHAATLDFLAPDTALRVGGAQPVSALTPDRIAVATIAPGVLVEEGDLRIEAFPVDHGDIEPAFGFRIEAGDAVIVISGDTRYSETLIERARGADLLIHEVVPDAALASRPPLWRAYHAAAHTSATDLARVAQAVRPGVLVLTHGLYFGEPEADVLDEIVAAGYGGPTVLAEDLDLFEAPFGRGPDRRRAH